MGAVKQSLLDELGVVVPKLEEENEHVQEMINWFLDQYEDPVENCPVDEGTYVFVYGGPYVAGDVLYERFGDEKTDADVDRAAELLSNSCLEWSKKPSDEFSDV
jgi:hypothetical protein